MPKSEQSPAPDTDASAVGAKVIKFDRQHRCKPAAPPIIDPLRRLEDEDERRRTLQNLTAAVLILLLLTSGFWLLDHLRTSARIEACLEAGHRNCLPNLNEHP
jgi:hypothetical protein